MHTTALRSEEFQITVDGRPATLDDVFPGFDRARPPGHRHPRPIWARRAPAASSSPRSPPSMTGLRAAGRAVLRLRRLLRLPRRRRPRDPAQARRLPRAQGGRGRQRGRADPSRRSTTAASPACSCPSPARSTRGAAPSPALTARDAATAHNDAFAAALVYSPTGQTADADVVVRGSAHSDAYIDAMLGSPRRRGPGSARHAAGAELPADGSTPGA